MIDPALTMVMMLLRRRRSWFSQGVAPLLALLLVLAAALHPCAAADFDPEAVKLPSTDYVDESSGITFPPRVGDLVRGDLVKYSPSGDNFSVAYTIPSTLKLSFYVYPAVGDARRQCELASSVIARMNGTASPTNGVEQPVTWDIGNGTVLNGWRARFNFSHRMTGTDKPVASQLYVFTWGKLFIKLRATYPSGPDTVEADMAKAVDTFREQFSGFPKDGPKAGKDVVKEPLKDAAKQPLKESGAEPAKEPAKPAGK